MVWTYEKFRGDAAIYAFCPKCKFYHNPSKLIRDEDGNLTTDIQYQYNYCPICGEYLYDDKEIVDIIWNERDIEELYNIKIEF